MLEAKTTPRPLTEEEDEGQEPEFKPLTREEAQQWRSSQPVLSPWRLVRVQWLVGLAAAGLAGLLWQSSALSVSVLYGAAAVALPSALMAYGLSAGAMSRLPSGFAHAAFAGFLLWEGVKILLSVAMLAAAPWVLPKLSWVGLLLGMVLVLKVYWFGFFIQTRRSIANG